MRHPVVHFEIAGDNAKQLRRFYSLLFQWRMDPGPTDDYSEVHSGDDGGIEGGIFQTQGDTPPYVTIYVAVEDVKAYLKRAKLLGGKCLQPPMTIPGVGTIGLFRDPAGNPVGLVQERASAREARGYDARAA